MANQYLSIGKIKYTSETGNTTFTAGLSFQRFDGSTTVKVQAIVVIDEGGTESAISDSLFVSTSNFTQATYYTPIMEKTATLIANHKKGTVKVKWRYFDTYTGGTNPKWSPYYYADKTYETVNTVIPPGNPPVSNSTSIYRYYKGGQYSADHFYTQSNVLPNGYVFEFIEFYALTIQKSGSVPIYRYYNPDTGDHFYTAVSSNSTFPSYNFEKIEFYAYPTQVNGTVPVYRYYSPTLGDHFYTTHYSANGYTGGYYLEKIEFYTYEGERD
ncbi:hypothetical protein GCM10023231_06210 [Olivibacter ginsenosidimutans]|uniref:DUF5648 domain-containing protein n=1 Tax=Olivibacter ginsenosidimutans TaxID=1176537 RepID=A0ABP9AIV0_9SPHI